MFFKSTQLIDLVHEPSSAEAKTDENDRMEKRRSTDDRSDEAP
jgi:hypothetical protein